MVQVIKSGRNGNTAEVNDEGELLTYAITEDAIIRKALESQSYVITSPIITLTSASLSYVLYIENTDTVPWIITDAFPRYGTSTGGAGDFTTSTIVGPTGGTLLSAGTAFFPGNLNVARQVPLNGTFLYGAEGSTATGTGSTILIPESRNVVNPSPIILESGASLATGVQPPAGNTSMRVQFFYLMIRGE